jgi:hypothetical protein
MKFFNKSNQSKNEADVLPMEAAFTLIPSQSRGLIPKAVVQIREVKQKAFDK